LGGICEAQSWSLVDTGVSQFTSSSLAEVNGQPALIYIAGDQQYYAHYDGTQWLKESILASSSGSALTQIDGNPAFVNLHSGDGLDLFTRSGTSWSSSTIVTTGRDPSRLLTIGGTLSIAYTSDAGGDINFASYQGGTWTPTRVFNGPAWMSGGSPSLVVIGGTPAIAYRGGWTQNGSGNWPMSVYYGENNGTSWQTSAPIDTLGVNPSSNDIQVASYKGDPAVLACDDLSDSVNFIIRHGGTWQQSSMIDTGGEPWGLSLIAVGDTLVMSYDRHHIGTNVGDIRLGVYINDAWSVNTIVDRFNSNSASTTSLALIGGQVGIAYLDGSGKLYYSTTAVPEPSTFAIFATGLISFLFTACTRRNRK
jgi:hypothetical protein